MKDGTAYASKLKKAYAKWRHALRKPVVPEPDEPLHRLATAILSRNTTEDRGQAAVNKLLSGMVDWNEIRVSSATELAAILGNAVPDAHGRCQALLRALKWIYNTENRLALDHLKNLGRREARQYLERIDGADEFAAASVMLWSLGGHAVPVSDPVLDLLREIEIIHPEASRAEVQAFLERHINAGDAREFCLVLQAAVKKKKRTRRRSGASKS
jgi:endonuclease III